MQFFKKLIPLITIIIVQQQIVAQVNEEYVKDTAIKTAMLFPYGNQMGLPLIKLNSSDQLELHFDDLNGGYKNYNYTLQLCNADWTTAMLSFFDFVKGFSNNRINTYRVSSIAQKKYTHYQVYLPERNCMPIKSGNYILKVYENGDTSKTIFTKKFMVYDDKVTIGAQIIQPLSSYTSMTHQRIITKINTQALNLNNAQQQLKLVVLQNNRWDNAVKNTLPTFIRGKDIEYNTDNQLTFQAGREWRWADLRSFRYWSDRVQKGIQTKSENTIFLKPDVLRKTLKYSYYRDINGMFSIENTDNVNPYWQGDYATIKFAFMPPNNQPFSNKEIYVIGKMSNYELNNNTKMTFNKETGLYEASLFLKQGFYNYQYMLFSKNGKEVIMDTNETEGNYWETENTYQVLVYYKSFGARVDELVGFTTINSLNGRTGLGF
jgi:Domain of unknown function (DUF5103)